VTEPEEVEPMDDEELERLRREHDEMCLRMANGDSKAIRLGLFRRLRDDPGTRRRLERELEERADA
jgi:hypothetical protein